MTRVLVLGARGMLGSMVTRVLAMEPELDVSATVRSEGPAGASRVAESRFDALRDPIGPLLDRHRADWIVNAVGIIKPRIDEQDAASVENAIAVNSLFPFRLAAESAKRGQRVIQIATDCVFSGATGSYDESAPHDPLDVYGKTKSLGEVRSDNVVHLRCSIIGPESPPPASLLEWVLSAAPGTDLSGYSDHRWNGVTTLHFARVCAAVIKGAEVPAVHHLVPADSVSKAELLELVLGAFGRDDVTVRPGPGPEPIDRTLATCEPEVGQRLWRAAGYEHPPTIAQMLGELAMHGSARAGQAASKPV